MQIGGISSQHDSSMHHVSSCIHDHGSSKKEPGGMKSAASAGAAASFMQRMAKQESFSLSAWLADPFGSAKKLFGRLWRGSGSSEAGAASEKVESAKEQVLANLAVLDNKESDSQGNTLNGVLQGHSGMPTETASTTVLHTPQVAAAASAVMQPDLVKDNPYFSAAYDAGRQRQTFWQKMRVRFHEISGFLTKRFSFSGKGSFQTKQEQPKEDLRKRSRYRGEDVEIDCVLTDDSYLLDSYNRKGEYRRLSAKK